MVICSAMDLTEWTRRNRIALGLTQDELAKLSTVSRRTIGQIEQGKTDRTSDLTLSRLEAAFGTRFPDLVNTTSTPTISGAHRVAVPNVAEVHEVVQSIFPGENNAVALIRAALVVFRSLDDGTKRGMIEIADTENPDSAVRMLNQIWPAKLLGAAGELDDESIDQLIAYAKSALPPRDSGRNEDANP